MLRQRIEYIALGAFLTPFVPARSIRSARQVNSDGNSYMDFRTYRTAMHFALTPLHGDKCRSPPTLSSESFPRQTYDRHRSRDYCPRGHCPDGHVTCLEAPHLPDRD